MADNTPITDALSVVESISTDELATLNGVSVVASNPRIKAQRSKIVFGSPTAATDVDSTHPLPVQPRQASTATKANVAASVASVALLTSNTARLAASIFNDSTSALYVNLGSAASTSAFVVKLAAASYYEIPAGYTGAVNGIWDTATGAARVCELT